MERIKNLLRDFGLTEYEIKAFLTLLKLKVATAEEISETGNIPLPRVYDTLTELKKKGFALVSKTRPKKFRPTSPEKALKNLIKIKRELFEKNMRRLEKNIKKIKGILEKIEPLKMKKEELTTIWSTEKRKNIQNILDELENKAKREILIFAGDMSWLPERIENIRNAIKRGVKIKILAFQPESKKIVKSMKKVKKLGGEVKLNYKNDLRGEIIDLKNALIIFKGKNKSNYELTVFENPIMIKVFKENFNFWWKKLK